MADSKKYDGSQWEYSLRKQTTASEIIVPPTTIYADGSNITTYTIKGNATQNGTPTPATPVDVQGVGTLDGGQYNIPISNGQQTTNIYLSEPLYKIGGYVDIINSDGTVNRRIRKYVLTGEETVEVLSSGQAPIRISGIYFSRPAYTDCTWLCSHYLGVANSASWGSYNYCLTVSSQDTDSQMRIRDIDRNSGTAAEYKAFLASQYAAGTPVTIWIVLTNRTETFTAPPIPTTQGANSITVDTTVQPSEFTATWTGWHNASVKEWDGSQWD